MRQLKLLSRLIVAASVLVSVNAVADQAAVMPMKTLPVNIKSVVPVAVPLAPLTAAQKGQIDQEIRAYLMANPEILIEISQQLQAKQQQAVIDKANKVIPANASLLAHDAMSPVAGNALGPVAVVEFFDYQCPHCKTMVPALDALILANKNVRIVYKEMPIFGPESEFASRAALAANKQAKYQAFHRALMKTTGRLTDQQILDIAKSVGLDVNKMQAVMNSPEISKELQSTGQLTQQLGLPGTPGFVILTDTAGKVVFRFIPGQTTQALLQQAVTEVVAPVAVKTMPAKTI